MQNISHFVFTKILGWKFVGELPTLDKYIIIVAPHTSNVDFLLGVLVRSALGMQINYIGKHSLFKPPHGWIFRALGGAPVDRRKKQDTVKQVAKLFREREVFRLALSPEGTRKKVDKWRTGFYYMALEAQVPIVMVAFDYGQKEVRFSDPHYPSGDIESDMILIRRFFEGAVGKGPENT